ncbi:MAG: CARDB domain-containing protein [Patescibacteria group bacterium]|nr:CARDB domain-containing protein [Patescibacteria group bacterium]
MKPKYLLFALCLAFAPLTALAADNDLSIPDGGFYANDASVLVGQTVKLYGTVNNLGTVDTEATAVCKAGASLVNMKSLSARSGGASEEVWFTWTPVSPGTYTLSLNVALDGSIVDPNLSDNYAEVQIFVDNDNDDDGIGDTVDPDDDNDGVPDTEDDYPLDPTKSQDSDGDGQDDSVDSDDDNDGLFDWEDTAQGSSPTKYDTDGDGVNDKDDAFPTDPNRTDVDIANPIEAETPAGQVLGIQDLTEDEKTSDVGRATSDELDENGRVLGVATGTDEIYDEHTTSTVALESKSMYNIGDEAQKLDAEVLGWLSWPNWLWLLAILTGIGAFIFFLIWRKRKKEDDKDKEDKKPEKKIKV